MRAIAAFALAGALAAPAGCQLDRPPPAAAEPALPQPQAALPLPPPADCTLGDDSPAAVEGSGLGLLEPLRTGDPATAATAALLAGTLSSTAGDWERAYAFCALVPATASGEQRREAAVCQTKAAISMGRARTACADALAREWAADRSRIGLGFAERE